MVMYFYSFLSDKIVARCVWVMLLCSLDYTQLLNQQQYRMNKVEREYRHGSSVNYFWNVVCVCTPVCSCFLPPLLLVICSFNYSVPNHRETLLCLMGEEMRAEHFSSRWNVHLDLLLLTWQGMVHLHPLYFIVSLEEEAGVEVYWDDSHAKYVTKHSQHKRACLSIWLSIAALANFHIGENCPDYKQAGAFSYTERMWKQNMK